MIQVNPPTLPALIVIALCATPALAAENSPVPPTQTPPATFQGAVTGGKAHLDFRYRLETVDQDPISKDATASTLRSRLNYLTGEWHGFSAFVEADNVTVVGNEDTYNSTTNGVSDRPIVADPEGTEVNQAYLQFKNASLTATGGRQRLILDNARFIGNVGWRQNEQTYDALTLKTGLVPRTQLQYSYVANVNRVTGPDEGLQPADYHGTTHVINAKIDLGTVGSLTLFDYALDFENAPNLSSNSLGLHWTGTHQLGELAKFNWSASFATQRDFADNPNDYSADYYLVETGLGVGKFGFKAGYEVLGGDSTQPNRAFQTPLATLHAFQGWADKFLTTPRAGVEDLYLGATAAPGNWNLQLYWHDFQAEAADLDYGSEWNASAGYRFGEKKNYEALLKFADYSADRFATDTTKVWAQFSMTF